MGDTTSDIGSIYRQELQRRGAQLTPANLQALVMASRRGLVNIPGLTVQGEDPASQQGPVGAAPRPPPPMPQRPPVPSEERDAARGSPPAMGVPGSDQYRPAIAQGGASPAPAGGTAPAQASAPPTDTIGQLSQLATSILGGMRGYVPEALQSSPVQRSMQGAVDNGLPGASHRLPNDLIADRGPAQSLASAGSTGTSPGAALGAGDTRMTGNDGPWQRMGPANTGSELPQEVPSGLYVGQGATGVPQLPGGAPPLPQPQTPTPQRTGEVSAVGGPDSGSVAQSILTQLGIVGPATALAMGGRALMNRPPPAPAPIRTQPTGPEPQRSSYVGPSQQDRVLRAVPEQQGPPESQGAQRQPSSKTGPNQADYANEHRQVMEELDKSNPPKVRDDVKRATRVRKFPK